MPMEKKEYLSKEKHLMLGQELEHLKNVTRREVAEQLEYAKSLGDLSENAEYHEARERQADTEDRIKEIEAILKNCVIISGKQGSIVGIGSKVTVQREGGQSEDYLIVGSEEADVINHKITHESPLGNALMDKKAGDQVSVSTPRGKINYKIVTVN